MASVSYQLVPGTESSTSGSTGGQGFYPENIAVGTAAPTTGGNVELRVDLANAPTREQVLEVIKGFVRRIKDGRYGPDDFGSS